MKEIGIYILNYNREKLIINTINSILNQDIDNYDLYVVDNASEDNSVNAIKNEFGTKVDIIRIKKNVGSSGGFNKCLEDGINKGYKYVMLADNDIEMDKEAVKSLYEFLEKNKDVGIAGSKNYYMDNPNVIWSYGDDVSFDEYYVKAPFLGHVDSDKIPEVIYSSHVAACSLMVRREALLKAGQMPLNFYLYNDDVEFGYKVNLAGYKVASVGKSKVWHKVNMGRVTNTSAMYYVLRNKINFFARYIDEEKYEDFIVSILKEVFYQLYGCNYKNKTNIMKSLIFALNDGINNKMGKARDGRILEIGNSKDTLIEIIKDKKNIFINLNDIYYNNINICCSEIYPIIDRILKINKDIKINLNVSTCSKSLLDVKKEMGTLLDCITVSEKNESEKFDLEFVQCEHVNKVRKEILPKVYIDRWGNIIKSEEDYYYFRNFDNAFKLFVSTYKDIFLEGIKEIKGC